MSGLNSTPCAVAPFLAAVITVTPLPDPRSMSRSVGVSFARPSIVSTVAWGVGTQMTSLPGWPLTGSNGFCVSGTAWADALALASANSATRTPRTILFTTVMGTPPDELRHWTPEHHAAARP
jgi:hypothetical protein